MILLYSGLALVATWAGGSEHAEDLYVTNSVNKDLITKTLLTMQGARQLGMTVSALMSMAMFPNFSTLNFAGSLMLLLAANFMSISLFEEVRLHARISHFVNEKQLKMLKGQSDKIQMQIPQATLAGYDEWQRMKSGPPDETSLRAAL